MNVTAIPQLLDERQAAAYLGLDIEALKRLRRGRKISHVRLSAQNIRYRLEHLESYRVNPDEQHLYVIPAREFVKVGIAKNPEKRWKDLRCANPFLEPIAFTSEKMKHAARFEKDVHHVLHEHQQIIGSVGSEWFCCSVGVAVAAIHQVSARWESDLKMIETVLR